MRDNRWSIKNTLQLQNMVLSGAMLNKNIAEYFGVKPNTISAKLKSMGLRNVAVKSIVGKWNQKHFHLRESVMTYFLNHTADECCKKFKLTKSEFKSLMTSGYKDLRLKHLRKETRRRDAWSAREYKFLLQYSGLRPRWWIAKQLNRGGELGIKDRLDMHGISSKNLNGLTLSQFREAFGKDPDWFIQTSAGPGGNLHGGTNGFFKIIPWVYLKREIDSKRLHAHEIIVKLVEAMAMFQEWYFEGNALAKIKKRKFV